MKLITKLTAITIVIFASLFPICSNAAMKSLTNCSQINYPRAILVVHASWCPACKRFMPEYEKLADDPKYSQWIFYEKTDDDFSQVCKTTIPDVPHVFIHNMQPLPGGNLSDLVSFLDKNASK